jgi:hypothetical protein
LFALSVYILTAPLFDNLVAKFSQWPDYTRNDLYYTKFCYSVAGLRSSRTIYVTKIKTSASI